MKLKKLKIDEIKLAPYNPRIMPREEMEKLKRSIEAFGYVAPVIVNRRTGHVVGGNQRIKVLKELGYEEVEVVEIDISLEEEKALNLALNRISGDWDYDRLSLILSELQDFDDLIEITGFDEDEIIELLSEEIPVLEEDDEVPEPPKEEKAVIKPGDLIELGNHRLLCGDSTNPPDVEKLMGDRKADICFTDPPYGLDYEGCTKDKLTIANDNFKNEEKFKGFVRRAFDTVDWALRPGAYVLATVPAGPLFLVFANDWKERGWLRQMLVWVKDTMVLARSEYHYQHEEILFGWKPGKRLPNKDRTKTSVWEFERPKRSREHPTMKPVAMWVYGITNHSKPGDILFDPFAGSGTALIACEKSRRKFYGIEILPRYAQVCIQRWVNYTGKKKIKINGKEVLWEEYTKRG